MPIVKKNLVETRYLLSNMIATSLQSLVDTTLTIKSIYESFSFTFLLNKAMKWVQIVTS